MPKGPKIPAFVTDFLTFPADSPLDGNLKSPRMRVFGYVRGESEMTHVKLALLLPPWLQWPWPPVSAEARPTPPLPWLAYWAALPDQLLAQLRPGPEPGTFAYYDGPSTNYCIQGSATYIGQGGRRYPCFYRLWTLISELRGWKWPGRMLIWPQVW